MNSDELGHVLDFSSSLAHIERTVYRIARASSSLLPDCMRHTYFDCKNCPLADPDTCLLAANPDFASYMRYQLERDMQVRKVIRKVIKEHGRPMYWDIIAAMVQAQYPQVSKQVIYVLLTSCNSDFARFEEGVYGLAEWKSKGAIK